MSRNRIHTVAVLAASFSSLLITATLWAAAEGHGEHGGHEGGGSQLLVLAFFTINFLLFVLVLRKYALPVIRDKLRQRRETVVQALHEAKRAKEEAEALRREYEQKLAGLAAEQERLRTQALEAAEREREKIVSEARRLSERIAAEAKQIAQREVEEARRVLRQDVADHAVRIATELLRTNLTPSDQSRLVQDLVRDTHHAGNDHR